MKNVTFQLLILIVISVTCSTCDSLPKGGPTYRMSDEFKRYIIFPKGSYWIYEEVNSNSVDSVYLYRSESEIVDGSSKLSYYYERYTAGTNSSYSPKDSLRGFGYPNLQDQKYYVYEEFRLVDYMNAPYIYFDNPTIGYQDQFRENSRLKYEDHLSHLEVNGIVYDDVKVFHDFNQFFSYQSEYIYFGRDVGIIKRELFNGQVWLLKRYFINR